MTNFTMLVHNRPQLTKQALDSVGNSCSLTVLMDKADHETADVVNAFAEGGINRAAAYSDKDLGTGKLRNQVISCSEELFHRGDYLYLSDNDVFFYPHWLEALIANYEMAWKHGFKVIGAYNHPYHQPVGDAICGDSGMPGYTCIVREVQALALQSMIMKWEVWDKYGPFNETPVGRVCMGEDIAFTNKIRADGYKIGVVDPPLLVNTGITNSFGEKIPGWELVKAQCPEGVICE
jgi:GT2 family glycosyltransferase